MSYSLEIVVSIATIIISLIALFVAVYTAKKQNKISLFEMRVTLYNDILTYIAGKKLFPPAEMKLLGGETKFNNGYKGDKEVLFTKFRLIYSEKVWEVFD